MSSRGDGGVGQGGGVSGRGGGRGGGAAGRGGGRGGGAAGRGDNRGRGRGRGRGRAQESRGGGRPSTRGRIAEAARAFTAGPIAQAAGTLWRTPGRGRLIGSTRMVGGGRRAHHQAPLPVRPAITRQCPEWGIPPVHLPPHEHLYKQHFVDRCNKIMNEDFTIEHLQQLVWDAGQLVQAVSVQPDIVRQGLRKALDILHPGKGFVPSQEQIDAVNAVIFGNADVIMIARTGAGKSMVYQAFTLMTGLITIQIVPLNRIGEEQKEDIQMMNRATQTETYQLINVCNITADTKKLDKNLYVDMRAGKYQHIIMSPEQAAHPDFREILRDPEFRDRVGTIVFDELHLCKLWSSFREAFNQVYELRTLCRHDTTMIGASATLSKETEDYVLKHAGFRKQGAGEFQTKIIRASIDRSNTSYIIVDIPQEEMGGYRFLYPLLAGAVTNGEATPLGMKKTLVFEDGRKKVQTMVNFMRLWLIDETKNAPASKRYTFHGRDGGVDVCKVVSFYTSRVAKHDQDARYNAFGAAETIMRAMGATTAMSTGTNIGDIEVVACVKFPITMSIEDLMQRLGRAGRAIPRAIAILFWPYWVNDQAKAMPEGAAPTVPRRSKGKGRARQRHTPLQPSGLSQSQTPGEDVGVESDHESVASSVDDEGTQPSGKKRAKKGEWSQTDINRRANLPAIFADMRNGECPRKVVNKFLGQDFCDYPIVPVDPQYCCNKCNPDIEALLGIDLSPRPPVPPKPVTAPRANTRQATAVTELKEWAAGQASSRFISSNRMFDIPSSYFVPDKVLWQIGELFNSSQRAKAWTSEQWVEITGQDILQKCPLLLDWKRSHSNDADLLIQCVRDSVQTIFEKHEALVESLAEKAYAADVDVEVTAPAAGLDAEQTAGPQQPVRDAAARLRRNHLDIARSAMLNARRLGGGRPQGTTTQSSAVAGPSSVVAGPSSAVAGPSGEKRPASPSNSPTAVRRRLAHLAAADTGQEPPDDGAIDDLEDEYGSITDEEASRMLADANLPVRRSGRSRALSQREKERRASESQASEASDNEPETPTGRGARIRTPTRKAREAAGGH